MRETGWTPVVCPLLAIRPLPQPAPDLDDCAAIAFTSINGVAAFAALTPRRDRRVLTVGDATAGAARDAGFADVVSANGSVSDLVNLVSRAMHPHERLLAAVAKEPVADLARLLTGRVRVQTMSVYEAVETGAHAPESIDAIMIHSPRAAVALAALGPQAFERRLIVAISEQAAVLLNDLSAVDLRIADHPSETGMLEALGKPAPGV